MNNPDHNSNILSRAAADLFPGYFAMVMATGIISIACFFLAMNRIAITLLIINLVAYVILWLLLLMRLVLFFPRVRADINNHVRGPGFFTTVAGTCVLGSQLLIVANRLPVTVRVNGAGIDTVPSSGGLASGLGPLIMGFAFDRTGSYRAPLAGFFWATMLAAAACLASAREAGRSTWKRPRKGCGHPHRQSRNWRCIPAS